ncbi:alkaline phosphatase family protein [Thermoproteota archaeon]
MKRIIVIGWDGATWDVLRPLMSKGIMKNLSSLCKEGFASKLESTIPPVTAAAWTSFMTGKKPSKHGIFDFRGFDSRERKDYLANHSFCKSLTLWEILSKHKKKSIVLNLPLLYPPPNIDGIITFGFDIPSSACAFAFPETIDSEIKKRWPNYSPSMRLFDCNFSKVDSWVEKYLDSAIDSVKLRSQIAVSFGKEKDWDLLLVHFQELDYLQHFIWKRIQRFLNGEVEGLSRQLVGFFKVLDEKLGELIRAFQDEETTFMLISDHGFGSNPGTIFPNVILKENNYLFQTGKSAKSFMKKISRMKESVKIHFLHTKNPLGTIFKNSIEFLDSIKIRFFPSSLPDLWIDTQNKALSLKRLNVDWSRTKAIMAMGDTYGFVYINPLVVKDDQAYRKIIIDLKSLFRDKKDPYYFAPLFEDILTFKEAYGEEKCDGTCPDLILIPREGCSVFIDAPTRIYYEHGSTEGYHRKNGIFVLKGHKVKKISSDFLPKLIDIFPTILALFNIEIPNDIDGSVLENIFEEKIDFRISNFGSQKEARVKAYSDQESDEISQKLKSLGYL